jgi:hypothetical protein
MVFWRPHAKIPEFLYLIAPTIFHELKSRNRFQESRTASLTDRFGAQEGDVERFPASAEMACP